MYQNGDTASLAAIIEKNKRFVYKLAQKLFNQYKKSRLSVDELFQEGTLGIIDAANRFDIDLDNAFVTYSWHWIRQRITRAIMDTG